MAAWTRDSLRARPHRGIGVALVVAICAGIVAESGYGPWHEVNGVGHEPEPEEIDGGVIPTLGRIALAGVGAWLLLPRGWRAGRLVAFAAFALTAFLIALSVPEAPGASLGLGSWTSDGLLGGVRHPCAAEPHWCDNPGAREVVGRGAGQAWWAMLGGMLACLAATCLDLVRRRVGWRGLGYAVAELVAAPPLLGSFLLAWDSARGGGLGFAFLSLLFVAGFGACLVAAWREQGYDD